MIINRNEIGRNVPPNAKIVNDASINDKDLMDLREKFKIEYARMKGWDPNNLTQDQLNEIYSDKRWKTPGLLLS